MTLEPPQEHPDLEEIDRRLHSRIETILAAEQQAAEVIARRTTTLRERLLEAEDAGGEARIWTSDQHSHSGLVTNVGLDHIELLSPAGPVLVMLDSLLAVELR